MAVGVLVNPSPQRLMLKRVVERCFFAETFINTTPDRPLFMGNCDLRFPWIIADQCDFRASKC